MSTISPITKENFTAAIQLLEASKLPIQDITTSTTLFAITEADTVIATIGIEYYNETALLRSLAVATEKRNLGLAKNLVAFLENHAQEQGIKELILLTTTAADFFTKREYKRIERADVPDVIKKSSEFSSVCPSSAIAMKKKLA